MNSLGRSRPPIASDFSSSSEEENQELFVCDRRNPLGYLALAGAPCADAASSLLLFASANSMACVSRSSRAAAAGHADLIHVRRLWFQLPCDADAPSPFQRLSKHN